MSQSSALLVLGNQLFPLECLDRAQVERVIMIEDGFLCRHFAYHQQKLVLVLAAMRAYAQELRDAGLQVSYVALSDAGSTEPDSVSPTDYIQCLQQTLEYWSITELVRFEVEGKAMEARLSALAEQMGIEERVLPSPMFLCSRDDFSSFLKGRAKVQMASFYKFQRTRLNLLLDSDGGPQGGRWSFDEDNRKKLPKDIEPPPMPEVRFYDATADGVLWTAPPRRRGAASPPPSPFACRIPEGEDARGAEEKTSGVPTQANAAAGQAREAHSKTKESGAFCEEGSCKEGKGQGR